MKTHVRWNDVIFVTLSANFTKEEIKKNISFSAKGTYEQLYTDKLFESQVWKKSLISAGANCHILLSLHYYINMLIDIFNISFEKVIRLGNYRQRRLKHKIDSYRLMLSLNIAKLLWKIYHYFIPLFNFSFYASKASDLVIIFSHQPLKKEICTDPINIYLSIYLSIPSAKAGCDVRSIFKRSSSSSASRLFHLRLKDWIQSFSSLRPMAIPRLNRQPVLLFTHSWRENSWLHIFPMCISAMWNANSLSIRIKYLLWFGWVLRHINTGRLFNVKYSLVRLLNLISLPFFLKTFNLILEFSIILLFWIG